MNKKLVIIGVGEIAEIAADYFQQDSEYEVVAFAAEKKYLKKMNMTESVLCGIKIVEYERLWELYPPSEYSAFVALGYNKLNRGRARFYYALKEQGYNLVSYISSRAYIGTDVEIGDNCFILENNVLQRKVKIGNDVFLWSGNHIGHRVQIKDHVFVSSHVAISGYCIIGEYSFLGINSCMSEGITIAKNCFIGGGVPVMHDTKPNELYKAAPLKAERLSTDKIFGFRDND